MTNQTNKLFKLFAIACFSIVSVTDMFSQIINEDDLMKDIPAISDIITIRQITLITVEYDNELSDIMDAEMNQIFQVWQQSLNGQVQRTDEPVEDESSTDIEESYVVEESDIVEESEALSIDTYGSNSENEMSLIESLTDEIEFLAYPNPAKDLLNIRFEDEGYFEISLFNVVGKLELYYQSFEQRSHILDVSNLPVGMYLLQISDGSDVKTKRVNVVR